MSTAKFIQLNDTDTKYTCNICSDTIEDDKIIALKCDPKKHIFCYDCICDWYKELKKKKSTNNYSMITMCPICMKNGGLLPPYKFDNPQKGIHSGYVDQNAPKVNVTHKFCGAKLKTKDGFCQASGQQKYGGLCGRHVKCKNIVVVAETNEDLSSNTTTSPNGAIVI